MDKLDLKSMDKVHGNIEWIREKFPNVVTEVIKDGKTQLAVDFDALKEELSSVVMDEKQERYQFTWPDKGKAKMLAAQRITSTLRPCVEESVDFDTTQNLYIEGDNLDVLKLLQETYLGKVKMIYIDPPYNTGSDFVYEDAFAMSSEDYSEISGDYDEQGNRLFKNTDSNGRFHTDWLNMIYPRLKVAKDLLTDDGVIFISIGQDESFNLIKICDEIYGEANRVGVISRMMKSGGNKGQYFSPNIEYILVYAKLISELKYFREPLSEEIEKTYNHVETEGKRKGERYTIKGLCQPGLGNRPNQRYWIEAPDGSYLIPRGVSLPEILKEGEKVLPTGEDTCWKWTYDRYISEKNKGNIFFNKSTTATALIDETGATAKWNVFNKIWLSDRQDEGRVPVDLITKWENRMSSVELKALNIPFDFAKPTDLIRYLIGIANIDKDSIILDFFSGSATTAHAVMQLNAEDGGNRKFIMVQLPEPCEEKSEAYKAGYKNICEIGKERIRRAGKKILEDKAGLAMAFNAGKLQSGEAFAYFPTSDESVKMQKEQKKIFDIGFRVLKLDSSNMREVYYNPSAMSQSLLDSTIDNVKPDRTPLDLLFQVMLDLGVELSAKIEEKTVNGKKYFKVNDNDLIVCFDDDIDNDVITEIAKLTPIYAVFKDKSFATDSVGINNEQLFKTYSPATVIKVI